MIEILRSKKEKRKKKKNHEIVKLADDKRKNVIE